MSVETIAKNIIKKYLKDDMIKSANYKNGVLTFVVDMLDNEFTCTLKISKLSSSYVVNLQHEKVTKKAQTSNLSEYLENLMKEFAERYNGQIEFYNKMETPVETPSNSKSDAIFEGDGEMDIDSEEGESDIDMEDGENDMLDVKDEEQEWNVEGEEDITNLMLLREKEYEILEPSKLNKLQAEAISKVSENLYISMAGAKVVLRAYRWNLEKVMNTFTQSGKEKVLKDVGLSGKNLEKKDDGMTNADPDSEMDCPCCFDEVKIKNTTFLDSCGHHFCNTCWKSHLTIKIKDGLSKRIQCMAYKCTCVVDENVVFRFIVDKEVKKKYQTKVLDSFVEDNDRMKWCQSSPFCGNACMCKVNTKSPLEVVCSCGHNWCFNCLDLPHLPASCGMMIQWKKKCSDDSETLSWIHSNTRDCPQCHKATEKNGGCNHISCKCGAHWCWSCGGNFSTSTVYSHQCNKFLEKGDSGANDTRKSLERYLHYYNHYNAHFTSFKNQKRTQRKVEGKIREMFREKPNSAWVEIEWLKNGMDILFASRNALMYSYVFAFYLFDKARNKKALVGCKRFKEKERVRAKNLFEDTQNHLEKTTEQLAKELDKPLKSMIKGDKVKENIMKYSVLNEKRMHALSDIIKEEMINIGEYILPNPKFIITQPQYNRRLGNDSVKQKLVNENFYVPNVDKKDMDEEMKLALELSRKEYNMTKEERDLQKAIAESMKFK